MCLFYFIMITVPQDYPPVQPLLSLPEVGCHVPGGTMNRLPACLMLMMCLLPVCASAQSRESLTDAAHAFDDAALRLDDNNAKATGVRKWTGPIKLGFIKAVRTPSLVEPTRQAVKQIALEAGIEVIDLPSDSLNPPYQVVFDENESSSGKRNCFSRTSWRKWAIYKVELKINPAYGATIEGCIIHEAMHSFGFTSHPHDSDSVLSYRFKRRALTSLDKSLIHALYDERITPGLKPAAASQFACRILGERMGVGSADIDAVCRDRKGPTPST